VKDDDDYYSYISQFYPEGVHTLSAGVHIYAGFPQIVVHFQSWHGALQTLGHEMSHACVAHLPLPRWLDEGIAQSLEKLIGDVPPPDSWSDAAALNSLQNSWQSPLLTGELAERHHAFWNEENIQAFWAGTSFGEPGDASELSYSLAEILFNLIAQDFGSWRDLLSRAHFDDAGHTAAHDCFGLGLEEISGRFLGEGNWRPVRKRMVELWNA
jgi:hypothetical protein